MKARQRLRGDTGQIRQLEHNVIMLQEIDNKNTYHHYNSASAVRVRESAMTKKLTVAMVPDPSSHCNTSVEDESSE